MHKIDSLDALFSGRLLTAADEMAPFLTDWRRRWTGQALAVAQPDTTKDVASIVSWCNEHQVPIVPQGGNTSLSGGATPDPSGHALLLSTTRLKKIRSVDEINNTIEVEAGATLLDVQTAAQEVGRLFPLSLAAEGSCTIGGNLSTNAGGVRVLRYGNTRDLCLGLEVVTPDGQIWDGLRGLRKDNCGYSLRDIYIGAEGTLGIITAAVLKLFSRPRSEIAAFVAVPSPHAAVELLQRAQAELGASLTAFELISELAVSLVQKHVASARMPVEDTSPWFVLIEVGFNDTEVHASESLQTFLESAFEAELITDAALSTSLSQFQAMWGLRESVSESQGADGPTIKHDIALPISKIGDFIEDVSRRIVSEFPGLRQVVFGHLGDGNLHYNISPASDSLNPEDKKDFIALEMPINRLVHNLVAQYDGSISAEHGLGVLRRDEARRYKSSTEVDLMRVIKSALDPKNIMNPGKVLS